MKRRQLGQAMVEYIIVTAAFVGAFFWSANADCPGYDNCISKVLTVMHDNFEGYSNSISSVQKYGDFTTDGGGDASGGGDGGSGGDDGGGSGGDSGPPVLNPDGITEVALATSSTGLSTYGYLRADGTVVDGRGNVVGFYSETDNTLTTVEGSVINNVVIDRVIVDEEGNILHLRAVTGCSGSPAAVYAWGYKSKASGKVFNNVNQNELNIGGLCTKASFKVVNNNQQPQAGRVIDGEYYAAVFAVSVSSAPLEPNGEVIYWQDLGICSIMAIDWDDSVNHSAHPEDVYEQQLLLFADEDEKIGEMDQIDYVEQTAIYGVAVEPNDCPSARVISQPDPVFPFI
ncbi:MAG: hypothetical protein COA83_05680 [Methylophaga sp.]|nr:MAG: hypothetical protein COA83_05680 [Methylophaga sp.]